MEPDYDKMDCWEDLFPEKPIDKDRDQAEVNKTQSDKKEL